VNDRDLVARSVHVAIGFSESSGYQHAATRILRVASEYEVGSRCGPSDLAELALPLGAGLAASDSAHWTRLAAMAALDGRSSPVLRTHWVLATVGVVLLAASVGLRHTWDPDGWSAGGAVLDALSTMGWCCVLSIAADPWRRIRQRRWRSVDPAGEEPDLRDIARQLRRPRSWARALVALGVVCGAALSWSDSSAARHYDHLLEVGIRVPGRAIEVRGGGKSLRFLDVEYELDGRRHVTTFNNDTDAFGVGDQLTMLIDPDDHSEVTAVGIQRDSGALGAVNVLSGFGAITLIPLGFLGCRRVSVAGDLVAATGWRRAHVTHRPGQPLRRTEVLVDGCTSSRLVVADLLTVDPVATGTYLVAGPARGPVVLADGGGIVTIAHRRFVDLFRGGRRLERRVPPR
jgi:hypothetical protein